MKEKIRILHVLGGLNRGGAETMVMNVYRNIDRSKIQFDFIIHTTEKCDYEDEIKKLGGEIYRVPRYNGKNHIVYKNVWHKFFRLHSEYKIIHGHLRSTAAIYLNIAKKYKLKTIAHSHNTSSGSGVAAVIKNVMQIPIRYIADYLFACSDDAGKWLFGKNVINNKKYRIIENSIDCDSYMYNDHLRNNMRKSLDLSDKYVIGHVGRFNIQKNHEFLLEVFFELQKSRSNAVLLLIGDGELRGDLEQRILDLEIQEKVIFTGVISNVNDFMQIMDIFVFPSHFEGLGMVVIEAQAAGLPCIVSDTVPSEAHVTNLIKSLSLSLSATEWANEILNSEIINNRLDAYIEVKKSGYNIAESSEFLEKFYSKMLIKEVYT
ncbi:glycosyltransferase family 1 protein [Paenibacillus odorifer]|uniref:glycosyltransferase family 1 protein n=1 Tax=Paenibacillus TaxID=44249 RepID=UPI00096E8F0B|nr:glycosyltransferase family 1 protein [Paenibacillus odorifer]OMC96978.1 glycosyl transferase family 1 [Paenibacillus odorifer]